MFINEYELPELTISAGELCNYQFNLTDNTGAALTATTWTFKAVDYLNRGNSVLSYSGNITTNNGVVSALVTFAISDTKNLAGKYVYQLTVLNGTDTVINKKGVLYVLYSI